MNTIQVQTNMTISVQDDIVNLANVVTDLQGKMNASMMQIDVKINQNHQVSTYNSTLLQRGFFSLERHFIEMKRKIFETQLNVVSINSSLEIIGDLRTEVLTMGQAMANTTTLITDQFHDVHLKTNALQESYNILWNTTTHLDDKINRLEANHTFVTGSFRSNFKELLQQIDIVDSELIKISNRTSLSETGLSELVNFSFHLDQRLSDLKSNVTKINVTIELIDLSIRKVNELNELQGQRISDNKNLINSNVTQLSLAANIFEAELSKVASGYTSLKNALGRTVSSTGKFVISVTKKSFQTFNKYSMTRFPPL